VTDTGFLLFSFSLDPYCDGCTNADISAEIYYKEGADTSLFEGTLVETIIAACEEIKALEGVSETYDPCPTIQVSPGYPSDRGIDGATTPEYQKSEESRGPGLLLGLLFAGLAALVAMFLLVRRRKNQQDLLKHTALEDSDQDQTFILDGAQSKSFDDNSMYPAGRGEGMLLGDRLMNQDVHKCSSATCELCDRRIGGVQFLPTGGSLPKVDEQRPYERDDLVAL
jgi:hypothetical protein